MNENCATSSKIKDLKIGSKIENMEKKSFEAKKEIENLAGELEKLIQNNILVKSTVTKNDPEETKIEPKVISTVSKDQIVKTKKCIMNDTNVTKSPVTPKLTQRTPRKQLSKVPEVKEVKVERVKHYDPKLAREYMKKQKSLRQNKLQEEIRHKILMQEEKRRKLKELQDKTLKILYNKNRQKSQRDKQLTGVSKIEKPTQKLQIKSSLCSASGSKILLPTSKDLKNKKLSSDSFEKRNLAATKIQATYRGFKQRVKYKQLLEENRKINSEIQETKKYPSVDQLGTKPEPKINTTPSWLQPAPVLPYPYNFITAVKQKLSLALYGYKYAQTQPQDQSMVASDSELNTPQKIRDDIDRSLDSTVHNLVPSRLKEPAPVEIEENEPELDQFGTKSIRDAVSDLKLNLSRLNSPSIRTNLSKQFEEISTNISKYVGSNDMKKSKSVASRNEIITRSETATENPEMSENSTGNDIESAILSGSESKSSSNNLKSKQKFSSSKNSDIKINDKKAPEEVNNIQKLNQEKSSYENTFTSYENNEEGSKSSSSRHLTAAQKLIPPADKLKINTPLNQNVENIKTSAEYKPQEINLKFEAEIKLLQTFQESLKQITKDNHVPLYQNYMTNKQDVDQFTQTSFQNESEAKSQLEIKSNSLVRRTQPENAESKISQVSEIKPNSSMEKSLKNYKKFEEKLPFVNYKRGSGESKRKLIEKKNKDLLLQSLSIQNVLNTSSLTGADLSADQSACKAEIDVDKNLNSLSLEMIEQQIRNEDIQLEHFKTLLKIREKALVDRTKGELVWLEITKRHLKEKGDLDQVSTIKKRQRGLILKLQHEKHEMQRLRSVHKASCEERKTILREHKNIIKKQLSTKDMLTQFKRKHTKEIKRTGPIKVYEFNSPNNLFTLYEDRSSQQSLSVSEQINIRARSDAPSEVESVDYKKSITLHTTNEPAVMTPTTLKTALSKREQDLKQRREKVEELLRWHQRLNEDEKQIATLEENVRKLTFPNSEGDVTYSFSGSYLNNLWFIITGSKQDKYEQNKRYLLSKVDMENFYENAKIEVLRKIENLKSVTPITAIPETKIAPSPVLSQKESVSVVSVGPEKSADEIFEKSASEKIDKQTSGGENEQISENFKVVSEDSNHFESEKDLVDSEGTLKIDGESITLKSEIKSDFSVNNISDGPEKVILSEATDLENIEKGVLEQLNDKLSVLEENLYSTPNTIDAQETSKSENIEISSKSEQNLESNLPEINESSQDKPSSSVIMTEPNESIETSKTNDTTRLSIDVSGVSEKLSDTASANESLQEVVENAATEPEKDSDELLKDVEKNGSSSKIESVNNSIESLSQGEIRIDSLAKSEFSSFEESLKTAEKIDELLAEALQSDVENESSNKLIDEQIATRSSSSTNNIPSEIPEISVNNLESKSDDQVESAEEKSINTEIKSSPVSLSEQVISELPTENKEAENTEIESEIKKIDQTKEINESIEDASIATDSVPSSDQNSITNHQNLNNNLPDIPSDESVSISTKSIEELDESSSDFKLISATDLNLQFDAKDNKDTTDSIPSVIDSISSNGTTEPISKNELSPRSNSGGSPVKSNKRKLTPLNKLTKDKTDRTVEAENRLNSKNNMIPENLLLDSLSLYSTKISTNKLIVNEAEELLRKQLQIEQEIKELEKQQQSEIVPYVFVREIPNKPPPPYQPPKVSPPKVQKYSIPSTLEQSMPLITKATNLLYDAYVEDSLKTIQASDHFENNENEIENNYNRFFFDLCKEITENYFAVDDSENEPSWMKPVSRTTTQQKVKSKVELQEIVQFRVNECLNFSPVPKKENLIICWSRNKRDHVDELLIKESQTEEAEWRNFEYDEITIKNELTVDILELLINDTIKNICKTVKKKMNKL